MLNIILRTKLRLGSILFGLFGLSLLPLLGMSSEVDDLIKSDIGAVSALVCRNGAHTWPHGAILPRHGISGICLSLTVHEPHKS